MKCVYNFRARWLHQFRKVVTDLPLVLQSELSEREKQITLKTQPPPIEYHLKSEEFDLMTVSYILLSCPIFSLIFSALL